jgi:hypothetical protein
MDDCDNNTNILDVNGSRALILKEFQERYGHIHDTIVLCNLGSDAIHYLEKVYVYDMIGKALSVAQTKYKSKPKAKQKYNKGVCKTKKAIIKTHMTLRQIEDMLMKKGRRGNLKEMFFNVDVELAKFQVFKTRIDGNLADLKFIKNNNDNYAKETLFLYTVIDCLNTLLPDQLGKWIAQHNITVYSTTRRMDLHFIDLGIGIEFDEDQANHNTVERVMYDHERNSFLASQGLDIIHISENAPIEESINKIHQVLKERIEHNSVYNEETKQINYDVLRKKLSYIFLKDGFDPRITKSMLQFVGQDQDVPCISFEDVYDMVRRNNVTQRKCNNKINKLLKDHPNDLNPEEKKVSIIGFKMVALQLNSDVCRWYIKIEEKYMKILIDMIISGRGRDSERDEILSTAINKITVDHTIGLTKKNGTIAKELKDLKGAYKLLEAANKLLEKKNNKSHKEDIIENNEAVEDSIKMVDGDAIKINDTQEIVYSSGHYIRKYVILDILLKGKKNKVAARKRIDKCLVKLSGTIPINNYMFKEPIYNNLEIRDIIIKEDVDSDHEFNKHDKLEYLPNIQEYAFD